MPPRPALRPIRTSPPCSSPEPAQLSAPLQGLQNPPVSLRTPGNVWLGISGNTEGTEQSHSWEGLLMNGQQAQAKWDPLWGNFLNIIPLLCAVIRRGFPRQSSTSKQTSCATFPPSEGNPKNPFQHGPYPSHANPPLLWPMPFRAQVVSPMNKTG